MTGNGWWAGLCPLTQDGGEAPDTEIARRVTVAHVSLFSQAMEVPPAAQWLARVRGRRAERGTNDHSRGQGR